MCPLRPGAVPARILNFKGNVEVLPEKVIPRFSPHYSTNNMKNRISIALLALTLLFQCFAMAETAAQAAAASDFDDSVHDLFESAKGIKVGPSVVAVIAIVTGLLVALWGYKLFRPVMFICGFATGAVLGYMLAERIFGNKDYFTTAAWIMFVAVGLIVGVIVMNIWTLGVFACGAAAGVLLGFHVNTSFGYLIYPSSPETSLWICVIVLGLICGFAAVWFERPTLIIATSFFGATATVWGIGYFAGKYPNSVELEQWRTQAANGDYTYNIPNAWWYYLAGTFVFFLLAMYFQFNNSALGVFHQNPRKKNAQQEQYMAATPTRGNPISHV
ncbi:hypothetical protein LEN26_000590 [Aphanomyces euteiches]|nr:hypothetical protein AeMF1_001457 [Aphanomyces euteiches]KAH9163218.1 hypothetical protein LEN26_000590 [Aphanomyces euteiches]KAH9193434.1 hypothetical protein AeNC1_004585 [Aphanomyces euteiches]